MSHRLLVRVLPPLRVPLTLRLPSPPAGRRLHSVRHRRRARRRHARRVLPRRPALRRPPLVQPDGFDHALEPAPRHPGPLHTPRRRRALHAPRPRALPRPHLLADGGRLRRDPPLWPLHPVHDDGSAPRQVCALRGLRAHAVPLQKNPRRAGWQRAGCGVACAACRTWIGLRGRTAAGLVSEACVGLKAVWWRSAWSSDAVASPSCRAPDLLSPYPVSILSPFILRLHSS